MQVMRDFIGGLFSVIKVTSAPLLYRYPYRTSAEALRGDWMKIGDDLDNMMGRLEADKDHGRRKR